MPNELVFDYELTYHAMHENGLNQACMY